MKIWSSVSCFEFYFQSTTSWGISMEIVIGPEVGISYQTEKSSSVSSPGLDLNAFTLKLSKLTYFINLSPCFPAGSHGRFLSSEVHSDDYAGGSWNSPDPYSRSCGPPDHNLLALRGGRHGRPYWRLLSTRSWHQHIAVDKERYVHFNALISVCLYNVLSFVWLSVYTAV